MIRKAKLLSLGAAAALALLAVVASSAFALPELTTPNAADYPVTVTGSQEGNHVFKVAGGTVECTTAFFNGTLAAASTTQTMEAEYGGCTAFGFVGATITGMRSGEKRCDYLFHVTGTDLTGNPVAGADLKCSSGDVQIDAGPCTVTLEPGPVRNQGLTTNTITNKTETIEGHTVGTITVDHKVGGIHAVVTSVFGCPIAGGTYTNATYDGSTTVRGRNGIGTPVTIQVK